MIRRRDQRCHKPGAPALASRATTPAALLLVSVAALGTCSLQGCQSKDEGPVQLPVEICPGFALPKGGRVAESRTGEVAQITCPVDKEYRGPELQCNWVDRFCVASSLADIDPEFCIDQYNLTLKGTGLLRWPAGQAPKLVTPSAFGGGGATAAGASGGSRHLGGSALLPHIVGAKEVKCVDEGYTNLDLDFAKVRHNNLFGRGPDQDAHESLEFTDIVRGQNVALEITARIGDGIAPANYRPSWTGKRTSTGRISINSTDPVMLMFKFKDASTGNAFALNKTFFTLYDISRPGAHDIEVNVSGVSEYFKSESSLVSVRRVASSSSYSFGAYLKDADQAQLAQPGGALNVRQVWEDSLRRSVVLVFRDVSGFVLSVRGPGGLEFSGWSELASQGIGMRVGVDAETETMHTDTEEKFVRGRGAPRSTDVGAVGGSSSLSELRRALALGAALAVAGVAGLAAVWAAQWRRRGLALRPGPEADAAAARPSKGSYKAFGGPNFSSDELEF
mmetsp:Transcript_59266/g.170193  ORF Transcript_59266/g.170193 Transcript_59266/m.170193 type:complete len:506 (-) Transcript_59266:76-1593(-)